MICQPHGVSRLAAGESSGNDLQIHEWDVHGCMSADTIYLILCHKKEVIIGSRPQGLKIVMS